MLECMVTLVIWAIIALICWLVLQKVVEIFAGTIDSRIMQLVGLLFALLVIVQTLRCMGFLSRIFPGP